MPGKLRILQFALSEKVKFLDFVHATKTFGCDCSLGFRVFIKHVETGSVDAAFLPRSNRK